jgi:hypothetical protein
MALGVGLIVAGLVFGSWVVRQWLVHDLDLRGDLQVRPALWSLLLIVLGCQVAFSALFLSILGGSEEDAT